MCRFLLFRYKVTLCTADSQQNVCIHSLLTGGDGQNSGAHLRGLAAVGNKDHHIAGDQLAAGAVNGFGAMDLSASVGKTGQLDDPEVKGMLDTIFAKCKEHNVKIGLTTGPNRKLYEYCLKQGVDFVSVGDPISCLENAIRQWLFND